MKQMLRDFPVIGVDEAGLGPVLGPLVVAGVRINARHIGFLKKLGVRDSKLFNSNKPREKRKLTWRRAKPSVENYNVKILSASKIDNAYSRGITMYDLEMRAIAKILKKLDWKTSKLIYLHQLGQTSKNKLLVTMQNCDADFLSSAFESKTIYEKEADRKYIPVSLASILAKVTRDEFVSSSCCKIGEEYVSGYCNLRTEIFMRRYFEHHRILPPGTRRTRDWKPLCELISKEKAENFSLPKLDHV